MDNYSDRNRLINYYINMSKLEAELLIKEADFIASRHFKCMFLRREFLNEIKEFSNYNINLLKMTKSEPQRIECIKNIKKEREHISEQDRNLRMGESKIYASVKLKEKNGVWEYILIGVGVAGALGQIVAGVGVLFTGSVTIAGGVFGATLIIHGVNGLLENYQSSIGNRSYKGPVRDVYEKTAATFGQDRKYGSIAYGGVDLMLSGAGLLRNIKHPDSRRLFHYLNNDYIRGYKNMSKTGLTLEIINDSITAKSMS